MNYEVKDWYYVPHNEKVKPSSVRIPKSILPRNVKTGDNFVTDHSKLGPDPFKGIRKDLVGRALSDDGQSHEWRFPESDKDDRKIIIDIP